MSGWSHCLWLFMFIVSTLPQVRMEANQKGANFKIILMCVQVGKCVMIVLWAGSSGTAQL